MNDLYTVLDTLANYMFHNLFNIGAIWSSQHQLSTRYYVKTDENCI